jgi:hypothetical protein
MELGLAAIVSVFDLIPGIGATLGVSLVSLIILQQGIAVALIIPNPIGNRRFHFAD